ncbi:MAG: MMPL family transporter [Gemmataceae bacterium]|nr:MMPL family transporter [Gemmataceae bacterium]
MFGILGRFTATHPKKICSAWLLLGLLLSWASPPWDTRAQDDDIRFLPERCPSVRGYQLLAQAFPQEVFASRAIFTVERTEGSLTEADFALVDQCVADLEQLRRDEPGLQIGKIASYQDAVLGKRLISTDRQCTLIQVALGTPFLALQTRLAVDRAEALLRQRLTGFGPAAPQLSTTGPAGVGRDLTRASAESLDGTTLATVLLVVVVLLFVYRAPLLALVPLATIAVSVWVSLKILALLTLLPGIYLVNVSKVFAIVILYGAGTDYCLFLISRYCEELELGQEREAALAQSVTSVGWALAASAGTVICGLGLMGLAEFAKVRCAGPAIALSLAVALLASLTLAPALLQLLGQAVFWPARVPQPVARLQLLTLHHASPSRSPSIWDSISRVVVSRPVLVWSAAVVALLPLAGLGLRVHPNYKATGELHPATESVRGLATIQRHFPAGEIGPLTVLLVAPTDWNTPVGRNLVSHLSRGFAHLENVAEVRSLTQPLGQPLPEVGVATRSTAGSGGFLQTLQRKVVSSALGQVNSFYLATLPGVDRPRFVTRLDVVLRSDPFDDASLVTLDLIQTWLERELPRSAPLLGEVEAACYSVTVSARDLAQVTESDRVRVNLLVLTGIFLILLILVRRPLLAAYLLLTVLFSYYATLGATALMGTWWSGRPLGEVDWRVPFFLFTILVAVGEDYNILLVSRVLQERQRHGAEEGTRRALARTGGTITSCGLIMAGTFATLMLAGLGTLVQIGFALAFGVLLDTFVVRPFLVPAFTLLVWRLQGSQEPAPTPGGWRQLQGEWENLRQAG